MEKHLTNAFQCCILVPVKQIQQMKKEQTPKTRIWKEDYEWLRKTAFQSRKTRPEILSKLIELGKQQTKQFFKGLS